MTLGTDDPQATSRADAVIQRLPFDSDFVDGGLLFGIRQRLVPADQFEQPLDTAPEHDIRAAACHVGGDGDVARLAGLRDDLGFAGVLLGVEHLVLEACLDQQLRQEL